MIEITHRDGHDCPEFICDYCREKVGPNDWIYWRSTAVPQEGHHGNCLVFHDSPCLLTVPFQEYSCMRVCVFLHYLCVNTGYFPDPDKEPPPESEDDETPA